MSAGLWIDTELPQYESEEDDGVQDEPWCLYCGFEDCRCDRETHNGEPSR